jgi:hypothetical protein
MISLPALAATTPGKADIPPPPPIPKKLPSKKAAGKTVANNENPDDGNDIPGTKGKSLIVPEGADIRIIPGKKQVEHQYRVNGKIVMIKIVPKVGKPYYILYPEGRDGPAVRRDLDDIQAPAWIIHRW